MPNAGDDPVSGVRQRPVLPEDETVPETPTSILRLRAPLERNHLHAAFRAILELGMRIVRAEVRTVGTEAFQTLHVREADERTLSASRYSELRRALRNIHGPAHLMRSSRIEHGTRAKRLRVSPTGGDKWHR